jgi:hypothetical protein
MKRYIGAIALFLLLTPEAGLPASKEQQEMQRDIAQLQDQVQRLQNRRWMRGTRPTRASACCRGM